MSIDKINQKKEFSESIFTHELEKIYTDLKKLNFESPEFETKLDELAKSCYEMHLYFRTYIAHFREPQLGLVKEDFTKIYALFGEIFLMRKEDERQRKNQKN